jgi:hypothetical protein
MPLPYTFLTGTVASSAEVNANFNYIMSFFGDATSPDQFQPKGTFRTGAYGQIAGFLPSNVHLGWNVEQYSSGGKTLVRRFADKKPASMVHLGEAGFRVFTTGETTGNLEPQLKETLAVRMENKERWVYIDNAVSIRGSNTRPLELDNTRLTYVAFSEPRTIMEGKWQGVGDDTINAFSYGVPSNAYAVELMVYATATTSSGAAYKLMRAEAKPHQRTGFITHAYGGNAAMYGRTANQGKVLMGRGAYAGKITVNKTASFSEVSVYVQGYYI